MGLEVDTGSFTANSPFFFAVAFGKSAVSSIMALRILMGNR